MPEFDPMPERYLGDDADAALRLDTARTVRHLRFVRGLLVTWAWFTASSFTLFAIYPDEEIVGMEARPATIGAALVSAVFATMLSWKSRNQHRALALRVETLARWMVTTGVTVTFAVAVTVRPEIRLGFTLPGFYLFLAIPCLIAIVLLRQRLARLDALVARTRAVAMAANRSPQPTQSENEPGHRWLRVAAIVIGAGVFVMAASNRRREG